MVRFIIYIFPGSKKEQGISAMNIGSLFHSFVFFLLFFWLNKDVVEERKIVENNKWR